MGKRKKWAKRLIELIPVLGKKIVESYNKTQYEITPQEIANHVILLSEKYPYDWIIKDLRKDIVDNKEWKNLLSKKITFNNNKITLDELLKKIKKAKETVNREKLNNEIEHTNKIIEKQKEQKQESVTKLSQEQQGLSSRRGSNVSVKSGDSWYSAKTSFGDIGDNALKPQIKTYSVLPPIPAKPKPQIKTYSVLSPIVAKSKIESFTTDKYEEAIKKIEKDNKVGKLSGAFGVKNKEEKEELAGGADFTSSVSKDIRLIAIPGRMSDANSFSKESKSNFEKCKTDCATMLQFCHLKDIMDLKKQNTKLHDALSNSEFSASLFLTDRMIELNKPEMLNDVYNNFKNGGLNNFNNIAGYILSGSQTQDNKKMRDILDANVAFYSDGNVDEKGIKYSTKAQNATNEALKFKICKNIIIELVLKNPDAMRNINIMICSEQELKEYLDKAGTSFNNTKDKAGTSFNNTNIKKLFVEKMPQKIQEWQKWIELGKDIDCGLYPEFGKFKQNVYELSQEYIKDLDNKIKGDTSHEQKEQIKKLLTNFNESLKAAFPEIKTVRQV